MLTTATGGETANSASRMLLRGNAFAIKGGAKDLPGGRKLFWSQGRKTKVTLSVGLPVLGPDSGKLYYHVTVVTPGSFHSVGWDKKNTESVKELVVSEEALMNCVILAVPRGQYFNTVRVAPRPAVFY